MVEEQSELLLSLTRLDELDGLADGNDAVLGVDSVNPSLDSSLLSSFLLPEGNVVVGDILRDSLANRLETVATVEEALDRDGGSFILAEVIVRNHLVGTETQHNDETIQTNRPSIELGALLDGGVNSVEVVGEVLLEGDGGLNVIHIVCSFIW